MNWFRAGLKALGWAVAAVAVCFAVLLSQLVGGWQVYAGVLVVVPFLAYAFHRSWRIAGLTAWWELLIVATLLGTLIWILHDALPGFRVPSG